ncbi:MAG: hypothetical protein J7L11_09705 [Thermoprotei archaeon]|nr:hypothetical protein [Thermoprotei archaeon]
MERINVATIGRSRLEKLRIFDNVIDIGRATIQLEIFLYLGAKGEADLEELWRNIGERRKAVCDALRKLRRKRLVTYDEEREVYRLTEKGLGYLALLQSALGEFREYEFIKRYIPLRKIDVNELSRRLIRDRYLYEVLVALGSSPEGMLPLEDLAHLMGLSPQRAQAYLDMFAPLIERTKRPKQNDPTGRIRVITCYRLTPIGYRLFKSLPSYLLVKRKRRTWFLLKLITKSVHPIIALKRLLPLNLALISAMILLSYMLSQAWICALGILALSLINVMISSILPY